MKGSLYNPRIRALRPTVESRLRVRDCSGGAVWLPRPLEVLLAASPEGKARAMAVIARLPGFVQSRHQLLRAEPDRRCRLSTGPSTELLRAPVHMACAAGARWPRRISCVRLCYVPAL